ncbi:hypothetical protein [Kitasatospora sp. NPDC091207]
MGKDPSATIVCKRGQGEAVTVGADEILHTMAIHNVRRGPSSTATA